MATDGTDGRPPAGELAEIQAVAGRAKGGDASAVPRLRELLARYPALWERYGDVAAQAEMAWIALAAGPDLYLKESLARVAEAQRAALARPAAPPVERLLADRAVACWVQLQYFTAVEANAVAADAPVRALRYWAGRQAQAQRMYASAVAALVTIQKLLPATAAGAAVPVQDRRTTAKKTGAMARGRYADLTGELHNRIESFFADSAAGERDGERVPAGASN